MDEKCSGIKKERLIEEDKFIKGSTIDKAPLMKSEGNKRDNAAVFTVYNPKTDTYEVRTFIKKKKGTNKG